MADRSSAALFASMFEYLAKNPDDRAKEFARELSEMTVGYDFNTYQMGCDEALETLGLARKATEEEMESEGCKTSFFIYWDGKHF